MPGPVIVKVYNYRHEAQLAVEILKSHDIEAVIQADDAGGMRPDLAMHTGGVRLYVNERDSQQARDILESFENGSPG